MAHSKDYLKELELLHSKKTFGLNKNVPAVVKNLIEEKNIKSFLDYGAGKGYTSDTLKTVYPDIQIYKFDPATFPLPLPKNVELTYSSDVLEHIEPNLIDETIQDLCNRTTRYQYHLIACHPAKKALSDGRNAHLIIESPKWWKKKIQRLDEWKIIYEHIEERTASVKKGPPRHVVKYIVILEKV
tara:strand:- start:291 stop:845 length:555 start_codon:yes stop_codon:yes gene_type:complete